MVHEKEPVDIPDKLYFKIGEVSDLVGVKPYVLRYWETEFRDVAPVKSRTNQRLYKRRDVETLMLIRDLLYKERFTINGAKKRLKGQSKAAAGKADQLGLDLSTNPDQKVNPELLRDVKKILGSVIKEMESNLK